MNAYHIDIQAWTVQGVKRYRAKLSEDKDYRWECEPPETLDMFRGRLMNTLNAGIITHFQPEWIVA